MLQEELASAQAAVARDQVYQRAMEVDQTHGIDVGATESATPKCRACGAEAGGGKFCAECGAPLGKPTCAKCHAELAPNAKFCAECGAKTGS